MQTMIRLARFGAKKKPFYRIVVASKTSSRNGKFQEVLGYYDPRLGLGRSKCDQERFNYWIRQGATPTNIVRHLVKQSQA